MLLYVAKNATKNAVTGLFQVRMQGHNYNIVDMKRISLETYMLIL